MRGRNDVELFNEAAGTGSIAATPFGRCGGMAFASHSATWLNVIGGELA